MRLYLPLVVAITAFTLAGCDMAGDMAGEAIDTQLRETVAGQCSQIAESTGFGADQINQLCECGTDSIMDLPMSERTQIDGAQIEEILATCAAENGEIATETANG